MKHIILVGDSIFDNASYVKEGESVIECLSALLTDNEQATLLAVDGDVTTDVHNQLFNLPEDTTHIFVSCGGNDALRRINILNQEVPDIREALGTLHGMREGFRSNYQAMLNGLMAHSDKVAACTIYNRIPGISNSALTALALFNEVILEEAIARGLPVIDLRNVCLDDDDYSAISPIEPSGKGALKIVDIIYGVVNRHDYYSRGCRVYTQPE